MKSSQARTSRAMVAIVGGTLLLSVIFWSYNLGKQHATSVAPRALERSATPDPTAPQVAIAPTTTAPTVLETPTTKPTSNLMLAAVTNIPSTQPAAHVTTAPSAAAQTASATVVPTSLSDAKSKIDQGRLLEARRGLNALLAAASLSDADLQSAKQLLSQINATVVFSPRKFEDDEFGGTFTVPPGGVLQKIASSHEVSTDLLMRINGIKDARRLQAGTTIKVLKGPVPAVISKKNFSLELWLGNPDEKASMFITAFPVGLGKDDSTPTGTWAVINKLKNPAYYSPRGEGVISADDPKNPLGEYWIGLTGTDGHAVGKTSYGIHGTTDPTSIGKQESMGCIRLKNEDAAQVYEMLVEGKSLVVVKD